MINFLISIVIFAVSVFLLAVSVRYGLKATGRLDEIFSQKNNSTYPGFRWYYRIPFSFGMIPEYFYAMVLGHENYFNRNWWALKTASFISVLLFIAGLKSRSAVYAYFSFDFVKEGGFTALFTSGNFVIFMNMIILLYVALFILIIIESIRMHGIYSPVRIVVYGILSLLMANLTIITLSLIVFVTVVYVILKVIGFLFFSSKKRRNEEEEKEETAGTILGGGFRKFKTELRAWEEEEESIPEPTYKPTKEEKVKRKRPKITRRKKIIRKDDDVPRLHPD